MRVQKGTSKSIAVVLVLLTAAPVITASAAFAAAPTALYCEANRVAAERAAEDAIHNKQVVNGAVATGVVGGGCGAVLYATGWFDGGTSAAICVIAAAVAASTASTPALAGDVAGDAYLKVRDKRCVH